MPTRHEIQRGLLAILSAILVSIAFFWLYGHSVIWARAHFESHGEVNVSLKLFWAVIFTFAVERHLALLGFKLPRRGTYTLGVWLPLLLVLAWFLVRGNIPGFSAVLFWHNLGVGVSEELFARGALVALLRPAGMYATVVVSSLIFTALHFPYILEKPFTTDDFLIASLIFSTDILTIGMRFYTNSIWPCMVLHTILDYFGNYYTPDWDLYKRAFDALPHHPNFEAQMDLWYAFSNLIFFAAGMVLLILTRKRDQIPL